MIKKRNLYILISILFVLLVILIVPNKNSFYEYSCSDRVLPTTFVYEEIASTNKTNIKEYINIISKTVQKGDIICKKRKNNMLDAGYMINIYRDALIKRSNTSHNLFVRSTISKTEYYKETVYIDHKIDTIGCIYKNMGFYCTPDRFPKKYLLAECPKNIEEAKKELATCYPVNFSFMK